jgi:hypothetical protein
MGGEWLTPRPGSFTAGGQDSLFIVCETGWAPGPVWTGAENLDLTGIRSQDRQTRSESLCRLRYPSSQHSTDANKKIVSIIVSLDSIIQNERMLLLYRTKMDEKKSGLKNFNLQKLTHRYIGLYSTLYEYLVCHSTWPLHVY